MEERAACSRIVGHTILLDRINTKQFHVRMESLIGAAGVGSAAAVAVPVSSAC